MSDLYIRSLSIDWNKIAPDSYLRKIPALQGLTHLEFHRNITFLAGENGSGKSTLLEALATAYGFNAEGGTLNYRFSTYDELPELGDALRLVRGALPKPKAGYFFRAESFFNVATVTLREYNDDGSMPNYHAISHGESFMEFISRYHQKGIYLMDEPEAALSPQRHLSLLTHIVQMAETGSQFIIATHSPILLGTPNAEILEFGEHDIHSCEYEETESYQITKLFIENREMLLHQLLDE